ncbi:MAG: TonB-dependent receptor [Alphaproteobacteria bacterium]|nr:TonB-dependent receptor [Alphaproteobacteria bacterium]
MLSGAGVQAQEASPDEILVQARKRAESLQNIPVSGSVLGRETVEDLGGFVDATQIGQYLTGVSVEEDGNPEYFIRGAGTGRNPFADSATSQQRNGADIQGGFGGRALGRMDTFDLQQIEVYRGPQGALYGRNAVGGVINVVNREPQPFFEYSALASYEFEGKETRAEATVNYPLIDNRLFLRVGGLFEDEDGLYFNEFLNEPSNPYELGGGRVSLKALFNERVDALLMVDYEQENYTNYIFSTFLQRTEAGDTIAAGAGRDVDGVPFGTTRVPFPPNSDGDPYRQAYDTSGFYDKRTVNALLKVNADLGFATASSTTSFRHRIVDLLTDLDASYNFGSPTFIGYGAPGAMSLPTATGGAPASAATCRNTSAAIVPAAVTYTGYDCTITWLTESSSFGQEFKFVSPGQSRLQWLAGVDYRYFNNPYFQDTAGLAVLAAAVTNQSIDAESENHSFGAFGTVNYSLTDRFDLAGSARYSYERKGFRSVTIDTSEGDLILDFEDARTTQQIDPSLSLTYTREGGGIVYASWAQAHRSGGFNRASGASDVGIFVPFEFEDEKANSYELGIKGDFGFAGGRMDYSVTAYRVDYQDVIQNVTIVGLIDESGDPLSSGNNLLNVGDAYVQGVEAELRGLAPDFLGTSGSLAYLQGISFSESKITSGLLEGSALTQIPRWSLNGNYTYRRALPLL